MNRLMVFLKVFVITNRALLRKITRSRLKQPWMDFKEIGIISEMIKELNPQKCLEWGAGNSTLFYPRLLNKDALWISIEHNPEWYNKISKSVQRSNTHVHLVSPNNSHWTETPNDGEYADFKDYVDFPKSLNTKFDFVMVDAKARKDCLLCAFDILSDNGIVVLHNANRGHYQDVFPLYGLQVLLKRESIHGGLWIGTKTRNPQNTSRMAALEQIWGMLNTVVKIKRQVFSLFKRTTPQEQNNQ